MILNSSALIKKLTQIRKKHLLFENEFIKLKAFGLSGFKDKNHFQEDGTQNYLVFQPMYKYFEKIGNTDNISEWKSIGWSDEIPDNTLSPE